MRTLSVRQSAGYTLLILAVLVCIFSGSDSWLPHVDRYIAKEIENEADSVSLTKAVEFLNESDAEGLTVLPGVGGKTAEAIVDERITNGDFSFVEDLMSVNGIGISKMRKIREYLILNFPESE